MPRKTKARQPTPKITAAQMEELLHEYDPTYLDCREVHWWKVVGYFYDAAGDIRRVWQCINCKTVKRNRMDAMGNYVGSTSYDHPDGYKIVGVRRSDVRAERIHRAKIYSNEGTMLKNSNFNGNGNGNKGRATYPVRHRARAKASK